ncbi:MAG: hypothetical protein EXS55_04035 [Candidatus Magasanikbacteria bacterium]|nr:hypothetical protein [Candidatus Magasanikbacteria bacterium]
MKRIQPNPDLQTPHEGLPLEISRLIIDAITTITEGGPFEDEQAIKDSLLATPLFGYREYVAGNVSFDLIQSKTFEIDVLFKDGTRGKVEVFFKVDNNIPIAFFDYMQLTKSN